MVYRRQWHYNQGNVKVALNWSASSGVYTLKFDNIGANWEPVKAFLYFLKTTIPTGERDYDDINKIWFCHEKHFQTLKGILDATSNFDVSIMEK